MRPRPTRPRLPTTLAALALAAAGCGRCAGPAVPPERWLPGDAPALVLPRLGPAASQLSLVVAAALQIPAAAGIAEPYAALRAQLGFDPLDPAGLAGAGLDPARGGAAALLPGGPVLLVLPVADADRLDALLTRMARERLGAALREEGREAGVALVRCRRGPAQPAALSWAMVKGAALVAPGPSGPGAVAAAAARPEPASLLRSPAFESSRSAMGAEAAALLFAPGPWLAADLPLGRDGAALGIDAAAGRLALRGVLLLPPARAEVWREVAGGEGAARAGEEELARLPLDLFAAGRFGGDPAALARRIGYLLPAEAAARLARAGLDPVVDLAAHLAPGAAAGVSLSPGLRVEALPSGVAEAARDPFRVVRLAAALRVKDARALSAGLEKLARAGPSLGVRVARRALPGGGTAFAARLGGGELAWALDGERLLVAGGAGGLSLLRAGGGWKAPTEPSRAALASGGAAAALDFGRLVQSVRALPPEAFGTGPDGFVVRALADRLLEPASHLAAASLRLEVLPAAARVDLALEVRQP